MLDSLDKTKNRNETKEPNLACYYRKSLLPEWTWQEWGQLRHFPWALGALWTLIILFVHVIPFVIIARVNIKFVSSLIGVIMICLFNA